VGQNQKVQTEVGGKLVSIEAGWMAKQANGTAICRIGDTMVQVAVVAGPPRGLGYEMVPLTVDYRERMAAAGKFPGGFIKREGRPSTMETLTARQIDRPLRPLFPEYMDSDIVISAVVLSSDEQNIPDIVALNAASAALTISDIPFAGPVGALRVGLINGQFVANPTHEDLKGSDLDLSICGTKDGIIMVEAGADEVSEEKMLEAFQFAEPIIKQMIDLQLQLAKLVGRPKGELDILPSPTQLYEKVKAKYRAELEKVFFTKGKQARADAIHAIVDRVILENCPKDEFGDIKRGSPKVAFVKAAWDKLQDEVVRDFAIAGRRADGRGLKDIRPIDIQLGLLPRAHGSALFTRGETQALCTVVLGTGDDEQIVDGLHEEYSKRFYLHYNFPSFSVGETKPNRGPGRREIGHGDLAERALDAIFPEKEQWPYTVRVISDILESNGSSSMATVCCGCLAMMDAGVTITSPVAGIAMGLVREKGKVAILTDILGSEDAHGDMDFKVAGTEKGITSLQMDLKAAGIPHEITKQALTEAREARMKLLGIMAAAIASPRLKLSEYAPRLEKIRINTEKIGLVIGPGGKTIRMIEEKSGATVEIEDDGTVTISSRNAQSLAVAKAMVEGLVEDLKIGTIYPSKVVSLKEFGAFCEILGTGKDGLVHVTEITDAFVKQASDYLEMGMMVEVKLVNIDPQGRNRFSIKAARKEKNLPPMQPLPGRGGDGAPVGGPSGGPGGPGGPGGEQRFNDSRPPRPRGPRPGPGGGGRDRY